MIRNWVGQSTNSLPAESVGRAEPRRHSYLPCDCCGSAIILRLRESFKTETGSVSVPTIESIQGMMPEKDWETIDDDWAQHDISAELIGAAMSID